MSNGEIQCTTLHRRLWTLDIGRDMFPTAHLAPRPRFQMMIDDHLEEAGAAVLNERVYREAVAISVSLTVVVNPDRTGGYPHLSLAIQREMIVGFPLN